MRSVNEFRILGNVGQDPVRRETANGGAFARFSVALNESWTGADGVKREKTTWIPCIAWDAERRKLAHLVCKYVNKGDRLYVAGNLETFPEQVTFSDGTDGKIDRFQLRVTDVTFLGSKNDD